MFALCTCCVYIHSTFPLHCILFDCFFVLIITSDAANSLFIFHGEQRYKRGIICYSYPSVRSLSFCFLLQLSQENARSFSKDSHYKRMRQATTAKAHYSTIRIFVTAECVNKTQPQLPNSFAHPALACWWYVCSVQCAIARTLVTKGSFTPAGCRFTLKWN